VSEEGFEKGHPGPEWLSAWHDGELQAPASEAVQAHVESCPACRLVLDEFRQLDDAARTGDDAFPGTEAWNGIEERLRLRLEDELSLGIPTGPTTPYVETGADLVLLPTPAELQAGRAARPFRLRWALATAAGLTVAIVSLRTFSDWDWPVGTAMKTDSAPKPMQGPAKDAHPLAMPPAAVRQEVQVAASDEAIDKREKAIAPRDYVAEVDQAIRQDAALGSAARSEVTPAATSAEAPASEKPTREMMAAKSNAPEMELKEAPPVTDPDYAMVFAAASRAREAGNQPLARRGFALVRTGIPDDDLAREAEYEEVLATARMEIAEGGDPAVVAQRLAHDAADSWGAVDPAQKQSCRTALANLRAAMTLAAEQGRPLPVEDADARLQQLRSCAR